MPILRGDVGLSYGLERGAFWVFLGSHPQGSLRGCLTGLSMEISGRRALHTGVLGGLKYSLCGSLWATSSQGASGLTLSGQVHACRRCLLTLWRLPLGLTP